jgi:hypothetical protein
MGRNITTGTLSPLTLDILWTLESGFIFNIYKSLYVSFFSFYYSLLFYSGSCGRGEGLL